MVHSPKGLATLKKCTECHYNAPLAFIICYNKDKCWKRGYDNKQTIGLSFSDSERLLQLLDDLVQQGASVLVTEHDPYILSNCDYLIEMGPGGGTEGGSVIAQGTPIELHENPVSVIGKYLTVPHDEGGKSEK